MIIAGDSREILRSTGWRGRQVVAVIPEVWFRAWRQDMAGGGRACGSK